MGGPAPKSTWTAAPCARNGWDNAVAERFFLNLKMERARQRQYANHTEARNDVADDIVSFYHWERLNSALNNLPPTVQERKMAVRKLIVVSEITRPPQNVHAGFQRSDVRGTGGS